MSRLANFATGIAPPALKKPWGQRLIYALTAPLDGILEWLFQGIRARFPLLAPPSALPLIARDRRIVPGPVEPPARLAARCARYRTDWRTSGGPWALLDQLASYLAPTPPKMRLVTSTASVSVWHTRNPDGTREYYEHAGRNWDWDSETEPDWEILYSKGWLIICVDDSNPWATAGEWGGGSTWGGGQLWGIDTTPGVITGIRQILSDWVPPQVLVPYVCVVFDANDPAFLPTTNPGDPGALDGWWGRWHKVVGGVAVPSRSPGARYFEGAL